VEVALAGLISYGRGLPLELSFLPEILPELPVNRIFTAGSKKKPR
jgi:hypothetical protein